MSPEATLRSDHVNLLIFRYLQESGFELAATAFHKDWHRAAEFRDPESLPFAHTLQRNELVSVVQAGLHYDNLRARASKSERKFRWTSADARDSTERQDGMVENGAGSRPSSSSRRKARPSVVRAMDDFPVPAPKRQRRSEDDEPHVNGDRDAMDVDTASADADADAEGEEDNDVPSPAMLSETEAAEAMERYDSVMTQTESKVVTKTSTMPWTIDRPGANALQGLWNPSTARKDVHTFLAVGENLCRFYDLPESDWDERQLQHVDEPSILEGSTVTACAWRPDGEAASLAIDTLRSFPDKSTSASLSLIERSRDGQITTFQLTPPVLEPTGMTISISYSPDGNYLLAGRTNLKRGLVQIWETPRSDVEETIAAREPVAWRMLEHQITDVVWTGKDTFTVCGENGLSMVYQVDSNLQQDVEASAVSIASRGLIAISTKLLEGEHSWSHLSTDRRNGVVAFASVEAGKLVVTSRLQKDETSTESDAEIELPDQLTAVAFQPPSKKAESSDANSPSEPFLLALAFESGQCTIFSVTRSPGSIISIAEVASLSLSEGPATALAWSPNGEHLAVGNADIMQIWQASSLKRKNGVMHATEAAITWRPVTETRGVENGHVQEGDEGIGALPQPSLAWSADGESLSFAADKKVAIIRFRPQLNADANGRDSP
ncbi:unnamed protein product [Zymoseptoria tritici ST99CH_1A5]|uniref:LisH domain-containing protein n=1 Tax=Zymoseptoria tritici ST99CH_1A5 TaxID=1276529 RepID=A0A1Y6L981_ZYMTR|nr:unnamed protein product [Zymoseptoria tritici ST99CH_3D1]SMY19820.1 unnamed protein product [Zymoseptoria tritici ST99CH_1A5]